jgi:hypothetical protein
VEEAAAEAAAAPAARSAEPAARSAEPAVSAAGSAEPATAPQPDEGPARSQSAAVSGPAVVAPAGPVAPEVTAVMRPSGDERTMIVTPAKTAAEQTGTEPPQVGGAGKADAAESGAGKADAAESGAGKADAAERIEPGEPREPGTPLRSASAVRDALLRTVRWPWLLAAAVLAILVVAFVALPRGGNSDKAHTPSAPTPKPSASSAAAVAPPGASKGGQSAGPGGGAAEGSAGAPAQPTPAAPVMLAGWNMYNDPTGFSVAAPDGWSVSHEGTILYFRDPNAGRIFGIDQTDHPNGDPAADWKEKRNYRVSAGDFPGYQEVGIRSVNYWKSCADWEFSYDRGGGRTHAINRGFVTSDHQAYGIWWSTPEASWQDNLKYFELITSTFKPKP